MQTLEELDFLAALDNDGNLSEVGIIMSEFPLEAPGGQNCVSEVVIAAAMLTRNGVHFHSNKHLLYSVIEQTVGSEHPVPRGFVFSTNLLHGSLSRGRPGATWSSIHRETTSPSSLSTGPLSSASKIHVRTDAAKITW